MSLKLLDIQYLRSQNSSTGQVLVTTGSILEINPVSWWGNDFHTTGLGTIVSTQRTHIPFATSKGEQFRILESATSAANYVGVSGASTGNSVIITTDGTDTNIGVVVASKGTGTVQLKSDTATNLTVSPTAITAAAPVILPTYTVAGLPSAATFARGIIYVSN